MKSDKERKMFFDGLFRLFNYNPLCE